MNRTNGKMIEVRLGKELTLDRIIESMYVINVEAIKDDAQALVSAINEGITYLRERGGGELIVPPTSSEDEVRIKVYRNKESKEIEVKFVARNFRAPMGTEARPYTGGKWEPGDLVIGTEHSGLTHFAWLCQKEGIPGEWHEVGTSYKLVKEVEGISKDLGELTESHNNLSTDVEGISEDVEGLAKDIEALGKNHGELSTNVEGISKDLGELSENHSNLSTEVEGLSKDLGDLDTEVEGISKDLGDLSTAVETLPGFDARVVSGAYEGVDLTVKFADEIANFANPWEWIRDRVNKVNFSGLYPGDYIRVDVPGAQGAEAWTFEAQIAGIDTYYEPSFLLIKHHIDWISRDCGGFQTNYHDKDDNNGIIEGDVAFTSSSLQNVLGAVESLLPSELREVISDKYLCQEERYSEGSVLTQSTGSYNALLGKLWVPTEVEVFGFPLLADKKGCIGQVQYPIFQNSAKARSKKFVGGSYTVDWWLLNLVSDSATDICVVNDFGYVSSKPCNEGARFPICFRIEQSVE